MLKDKQDLKNFNKFKTEKSNKIGHCKKSLIPAFLCFLTVIAKT